MKISDESYKAGLEQMKKMGREETMLDQLQISEDMYRMSVGMLFGEVWTRGHLSLRERQLITLAANIALARPHGTHTCWSSATRYPCGLRSDSNVTTGVGGAPSAVTACCRSNE